MHDMYINVQGLLDGAFLTRGTHSRQMTYVYIADSTPQGARNKVWLRNMHTGSSAVHTYKKNIDSQQDNVQHK